MKVLINFYLIPLFFASQRFIGHWTDKRQNLDNTVTWCTISEAEQDKCNAFARAVDREIAFFDYNYISVQCKQASNKEECMALLDEEKAQITTLDAGEIFIAGRYHSLIPFMQELYENGEHYQHAVAVIKKGSLSDVQNLHDLRGKKACFAGLGMLAGGLEVVDCNNHVKSAIKYFGPSCAVNSLIDKHNPLGDNSDQLCKLCVGKLPGGKCTTSDPYAGYEGAFRCLVEVGEIAFLVHTTFELLCRDGSRKPIDEYKYCNWGTVPSRAIVTSSATKIETRRLYQRFLEKAVEILGKHMMRNSTQLYDDHFENRPGFNNRFGEKNFNRSEYANANEYNTENFENHNGYEKGYDGNELHEWDKTESTNIQPIETFNLFESAPKYGMHHNLMFSVNRISFLILFFFFFLNVNLNDPILEVHRCPVDKMTLCVTSDPEMEKCVKMKIALKAQLLKPELNCHKGHSQIHCMQAIQSGIADVAMLDTSDVYTAGLRYDLIPFISEVYNLPTAEYYVVAVVKEEDDNTDLTYLKNKYTCHTGINTAAGWVYPMAYLISNTWIRGYGCDSVRAAAEYFTKSCVPGALSTEYNTGVPYDNMCDLCHGASFRYCRRDASEDYYGYTGAFRCLVEGGGDVAFVKHTTVAENTDGKRRETWARNTFTKDFELLCPDGTRRPTSDYVHCNLGKVAANAIVTRGGYYGYNESQMNAYINLFIYAQQFYGRKEQDEYSFSMFYSQPPYTDLIFQDATQQLVVIPPEKREFSAYLGPDFMRARRIVDCNAGASAIGHSIQATMVTILLTYVFSR
ncbi:Melanotransferrin [Eufriesea mexicana]|uniref:Melanotransferrin n=1 Tax=Eufriesea mexicana TaxID=516756 RepID=A0A310ST70_9HYME|nr:Melanotransferrin [Eufriesea mexicana]